MTGAEVENSKSVQNNGTGEELEKFQIVPNEATGKKKSATMDNRPEIMDQNLDEAELALAMSRNTVLLSSEDIKRVDARLRRLHCTSRDRLRCVGYHIGIAHEQRS